MNVDPSTNKLNIFQSERKKEKERKNTKLKTLWKCL
jgi:hypothetical protein